MGLALPPKWENIKSPCLLRYSCPSAMSRILRVFQFCHFASRFPPWLSGICLEHVQRGSGSVALVGLVMSARGHVTLMTPSPPPFWLAALPLHFPAHFYKIRENAVICFGSSHSEPLQSKMVMENRGHRRHTFEARGGGRTLLTLPPN